jgi:hypothetical protein
MGKVSDYSTGMAPFPIVFELSFKVKDTVNDFAYVELHKANHEHEKGKKSK